MFIYCDLETSGSMPQTKFKPLQIAIYLNPGKWIVKDIRHKELMCSSEAMGVNKIDVASLADPLRTPLVLADKELSSFVWDNADANFPHKNRIVGFNAPSFDLAYIREYFPKLTKRIHPYSGVDLNSALVVANGGMEYLQEAKDAMKWYASLQMPEVIKNRGAHDALYDAAEAHAILPALLNGQLLEIMEDWKSTTGYRRPEAHVTTV